MFALSTKHVHYWWLMILGYSPHCLSHQSNYCQFWLSVTHVILITMMTMMMMMMALNHTCTFPSFTLPFPRITILQPLTLDFSQLLDNAIGSHNLTRENIGLVNQDEKISSWNVGISFSCYIQDCVRCCLSKAICKDYWTFSMALRVLPLGPMRRPIKFRPGWSSWNTNYWQNIQALNLFLTSSLHGWIPECRPAGSWLCLWSWSWAHCSLVASCNQDWWSEEGLTLNAIYLLSWILSLPAFPRLRHVGTSPVLLFSFGRRKVSFLSFSFVISIPDIASVLPFSHSIVNWLRTWRPLAQSNMWNILSPVEFQMASQIFEANLSSGFGGIPKSPLRSLQLASSIFNWSKYAWVTIGICWKRF